MAQALLGAWVFCVFENSKDDARMIFRRTIFSSLIIGLIAGLVLSLCQVLSVNPIIFSAETFEIESSHDHGSHDHSAEAWSPEEGAERTAYTVLANVFAGTGFAALLLALMSQLQLMAVTRLTLLKGLAWGVAGFTAFFIAPGIGLPPEIPGIEAKPVEHRQTWWLFTVILVALGLMVMAFAPLKYKALGAVSLVLPYLVTIPHHQGPAFSHPDAEAVETLTRLHQEFIVATGLSNLAFWLVLGLASAWLLNVWVLKGVVTDDTGNIPSV